MADNWSIYVQDINNTWENRLDTQSYFEPYLLKVSSVNDMVNQIEALTQHVVDVDNNPVPPVPIDKITIFGHGSPGYISIGAGSDVDDLGAKSLQIAPGLIPPRLNGVAHETMARMRPWFSQSAELKLRGCNVAKGDAGVALLECLSTLLNVFVEGPISLPEALVPGSIGAVWRCYRSTCWMPNHPGV
jgi:hypothetical protein